MATKPITKGQTILNSLPSAGQAGGILSTALGFGSSLLSARERTRGLLQEGRDMAIQAEIEEFNAQVTENDLRADLMRTLSSNNVVAAASGAGGGGEAGLAEDFDVFGRQVRNVRLDAMLKAGALRRGARGLRKAGKTSSIVGLLDAGAQLAGAL